MNIELHFPLGGQSLPSQSGYDLYGALSRVLPRLHEANCPWQVGPASGAPTGDGAIRLDATSRLRLRLPVDDIPPALPLAGKALDVAGHRVRLGVPQVRALIPASILAARLVLLKIKGVTNPTPEEFLAAVRRQLDERGIRSEATLPLARGGLRPGEPRRGVLRIKGRAIVGYSVMLTGLADADSLALQVCGLGGRRKMGCGWFGPIREKQS